MLTSSASEPQHAPGAARNLVSSVGRGLQGFSGIAGEFLGASHCSADALDLKFAGARP